MTIRQCDNGIIYEYWNTDDTEKQNIILYKVSF